MQCAAAIIKEARQAAGLTQMQLAGRLGISQGAVAQLERERANPTFATLERVVRATGHRVELRIAPQPSAVDPSLLREALRLSPAERIAAAEQLTREAEQLAAAADRSRAK